MKRLGALVLALALLAIAGCAAREAETDNARWYSFSSSNDYLSITNGKLLITDAREEVYGGVLTLNDDVAVRGYTVRLYILQDDYKRTLLSNISEAMSGQLIRIGSDIGKASREPGQLLGEGLTEAELMDNLYFELELTEPDGDVLSMYLRLDVQPVEVDA